MPWSAVIHEICVVQTDIQRTYSQEDSNLRVLARLGGPGCGEPSQHAVSASGFHPLRK